MVRTNYRKEDWKKIFSQLKKDHSVIFPYPRECHNIQMFSERTRFMIISDAFAMAELGELNYESLFDLFDYIPKETVSLDININ